MTREGYCSRVWVCLFLLSEQEIGGELVPKHLCLIGCYEGQQHLKVSLHCDKYLDTMYQKCTSGKTTMWCDGNFSDDGAIRTKHKTDSPSVGSTKSKKQKWKMEEEDDYYF